MTPVKLAPTLPTNPDVVIIGAGAAGIGAARRLMKKGLSVVIVEAETRVGGRAWTDTTQFGVPVDMGCSWMSGSDNNSLTKIARKAGFTLVEHTDAGVSLFRDGKPATRADHKGFETAAKAVQKAITKAGKAGLDLPAEAVAPQNLDWTGAAKAWLGPMDYGVEFDSFSTLEDYHFAGDQPSHFTAEGMGAVVAGLAAGLPFKLGTIVTGVDWSGAGVRVETDEGTIAAKACLVTVSTGVLASGAIRFTPDLSVATSEALHGIPMGLLVKVPMLFDGARLDLPDNDWVTYWVPDEIPVRACFFIAWPCGADYLFGNIGGQLGWELSREDPAVTVDFALQELVNLVGSNARKHFVKGLRTDWANNPFTKGAYSCVKPGHFGARKALRQPLGDRVFFAGEATEFERPSLADGAFDSGRRAAKAIARLLQPV